MKNHHLRNLVFFGLALFTSACVTVKIPTGSGSPAKGVEYANPSSPFEKLKVDSADHAWLSEKTGNTISFLSDCNGTSDPSLQQLANDPLTVFEHLEILETKNMTYNGRDALLTEARGEVDGISVRTSLLVFKKNNCTYTLSYGGVAKNFETEKNRFETFIENFKAP